MAKVGNKIKYEKYKNSQRREKNKIHKIEKYLKEHPNNQVAVKRIEEIRAIIK